MYKIISSKKQNHWRWPPALNFFFGGTGGGFYILMIFFGPDGDGIIDAHFLKLIPPAFVMAGLLSVAAEAGRPFRGLYLFLNIKSSWMSREIVFAVVFIVLSLSGLIIDSPVVSFFAGSAAVLFVISQAMILYRSYAVPAWNWPAVPLLFISNALLNGFGLALLLGSVNFYTVKIDVLAYGLICILLTLATWLWGVYAQRDKETRAALEGLRSNRMLFTGTVLGCLLPFLGIGGFIFGANPPEGSMVAASYGLCAAAILFSGYYRLCRLVFGIDYLRPVLVDTPGN